MTELKRLPDYPERLFAHFEARRYAPFAWGSNDCCLFAADGILAQTGTDIAVAWRGYTTDREALRLIQDIGGMRGFAAALIERKPAFAQRGEVVLVEMDGRETFGLIAGNGHYCGPGADGLIFRPMSDVIAAYGF